MNCQLPHSATLRIVCGSVVGYAGDAIVNAANQGCITGGGVDGAITKAGGKALAAARRALPIVKGKTVRCPTGEAVITVGGDLKAKYCIHSVGPNYNVRAGWHVEDRDKKTTECDKLLYSSYRESMICAREAKLESVGFSLISAGIFRGHRTLVTVLALGLEAIKRNSYAGLKEVALFAFNAKEEEALKTAASVVFTKDEEDLRREVHAVADIVENTESLVVTRRRKRKDTAKNDVDEMKTNAESTVSQQAQDSEAESEAKKEKKEETDLDSVTEDFSKKAKI
mmetsp:Transcript_14398/g.35103  ORF Transcript_14398/g.35103 Transcript_14398/m.35103 type:complete len:283 (+) Transcript_14398:53-901(+)